MIGAVFGLGIVRISGPSMQPLFADGDYLIFRRIGKSDTPASLAGQSIIVRHPQFGQILKAAIPAKTPGKVALKGMSILSTEADHLGEVGMETVLGVGTVRISPRGLSFVRRVAF